MSSMLPLHTSQPLEPANVNSPDAANGSTEVETMTSSNTTEIPRPATDSPATQPAPLRTRIWVTILLSVCFMNLFISLFAVAFAANSARAVFIGLLLTVLVWEASMQFQTLSTYFSSSGLRFVWQHVRVALLGGSLVGMSFGFLWGFFFSTYTLVTKGLPQRPQRSVDTTAPTTKPFTPKAPPKSLFFSILLLLAPIASMPAGIMAICWFYGESIDQVTRHPLRGTMIAFVGSLVCSVKAWLKKRREAKKVVPPAKEAEEQPPLIEFETEKADDFSSEV